MSGFDSDVIAHPRDVSLSQRRQQELSEVCARLEALREKKHFDQAIDYLADRLSSLQRPDPDDPGAQSAEDAAAKSTLQDRKLWRGALHFLKADLHLDQGDADVALEEVEAALKAGWRTREAFNLAGWANYAADRPAVARDQFDRALARDPDHISSLMGRALALTDLEDFDHARSDLTHAINIDGSDAELYALRSDVLVRAHQVEQAERDIQQARELDDESDYALQHARLLLVQGRTSQAEEVMNAAFKGGEEVALDALLLRSHLHLNAGRLAQARADAIRASNNFPDEAFAFVQLAHVQLAAKKANSALKAADRAVQLDPSLSDAYMVRGAARHLRGLSDEAREDFNHAHQAPAELPLLLLGPCYELVGGHGFGQSLQQVFSQYAQAAAEAGVRRAGEGSKAPESSAKKPTAASSAKAAGAEKNGAVPPGVPPDLGDFDPVSLLGQVFDDSGKMKKRFKPFLEMAMKNAPSILKKMPPGLLPKVDGFDPEDLEKIDFSKMSPEELEEQMRQFYEQMQSGADPFGNDPAGAGTPAGGDKKP